MNILILTELVYPKGRVRYATKIGIDKISWASNSGVTIDGMRLDHPCNIATAMSKNSSAAYTTGFVDSSVTKLMLEAAQVPAVEFILNPSKFRLNKNSDGLFSIRAKDHFNGPE